uniref:Uncharacterized protein n=1 Tax=Quercus lobata TaxID=97700 RepID=A0A7N2KUB7_QUELO
MGGGGVGGGGSGKVEVVESKGCSKLLIGLSTPMSSMRSLHPFEPMSPASSSLASETFTARSGAPFAGLVICVTGLSKANWPLTMFRYMKSCHSEKSKLIVKYHFLTVLFPIDRFSEMGPFSRMFQR